MLVYYTPIRDLFTVLDVKFFKSALGTGELKIVDLSRSFLCY